MNRRGPVMSISLILMLTVSGAGAQPSPTRNEFVPDEVLVSFRPDVNPEAVARAVGARITGVLEGLGVHVLKVPAGAVEGTLRALDRSPLVEFAEPNGIVHAFVVPKDPNDPGYSVQWGWQKVAAPEAWALQTGSKAVKVAVVDTGIDVGYAGNPPDEGHPDLVGCRSASPIIVRSFISDESVNDNNGHGTHVAGTVGACTDNDIGVAGANWAVQLMAVKVLDFSGSGSVSDVASGIRWAADNGAKVINLSLGTSTRSKTLERAVNYAWNKDAVVVCAAGNDGDIDKFYPAAYANCIAVAATDSADNKAAFSSYGASWVDVAAPGVNIYSTMQDSWYWCFLCSSYGSPPGYAFLSGTSMAAPHVAGLAALVWGAGTCANNTCVRNRIESTADPIPGTRTYWQWGRINYYNAVK